MSRFCLLMEGITPTSSTNGSINKYKFSDKELQLDLSLNQYDLGARFYDPVIGRFNVIDPLADFASDYTPFRYAFDNPLALKDPSGLWEEDEDYRNEDGYDSHTLGRNVVYDESSMPKINISELANSEIKMNLKEHMDQDKSHTSFTDDWNDEFDDRDNYDTGVDDVFDFIDLIIKNDGDHDDGVNTHTIGHGAQALIEAAGAGLEGYGVIGTGFGVGNVAITLFEQIKEKDHDFTFGDAMHILVGVAEVEIPEIGIVDLGLSLWIGKENSLGNLVERYCDSQVYGVYVPGYK